VKKPKQTRRPGVEPGDAVYFKMGEQHAHGKVLCHGEHGCHVEHEGGRSRVYWSDILGHKQRAGINAQIVDKGEDGFLTQDDKGRRRFIAGEAPEPEPERREDTDDDHQSIIQDIHRKTPMTKSIPLPESRLLFFKGGQIANRAGLTKKQITDSRGHQTTRWVRTNPDQPKGREPGKDPDPTDARGSKAGYGTHDIQPGSKVKFKAGEHQGEGEVTAVGKHGLTAKDSTGREHQVHHHEVTHFKAGEGVKKPEITNTVLGKQDPIPAESFAAADYAKSHDQADVSVESVLANFPGDTTARIEAAQKRLEGIEDTLAANKKDGKWSAQREILHHKIMSELLSPEAVKNATPADGENPTFIILGGRGGSGKSSFEGTVYDPKKAIVLDADHIKGMIPEYEGWNAASVHNESGEIFDNAVRLARELGLNVVLDKTMKTAKSAIADVQAFKDAGYRTEAHYMHLPRQEAAKRAVGRFLGGGEKGRYVPVDVVLANTTNEDAFDQVKGMCDAWSFRDNNVKKGEQPILISQSGDAAKQGDAPDLKKSQEAGTMILLFRRK
jgi:predicted ABC-type ATPase